MSLLQLLPEGFAQWYQGVLEISLIFYFLTYHLIFQVFHGGTHFLMVGFHTGRVLSLFQECCAGPFSIPFAVDFCSIGNSLSVCWGLKQTALKCCLECWGKHKTQRKRQQMRLSFVFDSSGHKFVVFHPFFISFYPLVLVDGVCINSDITQNVVLFELSISCNSPEITVQV